jgi:hypothetical protein
LWLTIVASKSCWPRLKFNYLSRMCSEAWQTLSFVMSVAFAGALPNAKLILCSRNSASETIVPRDASSAL